MRNWLRFFFCSFFSDRISKDGAKRGYTTFFVGLILAFTFLWAGYVGGDILPLGVRYGNSPDFMATMHTVFSNADANQRLNAEIKDGSLLVKKSDGEYSKDLLVNTFENESDRENYSKNGYNVVVDLHPADTPAEFEIRFVSNNGKDLTLTYEEYSLLNAVEKLYFDLELTYTGKALELNDETVEAYRTTLEGLNSEIKPEIDSWANDLASNKITRSEYNRAIYELYFANYYPDITAYESSSKIPLLRNYYYHQYISRGAENYVFIFDDYVTASFETKDGTEVSFYGFYDDMADGAIVASGASQSEANRAVDDFVKQSILSVAPLTLYAYAMNVFSLIPFFSLIPLVVVLLAYSILKLMGVENIKTFGTAFKILGSYVWVSAFISAVTTVVAAFFVPSNIVTALPPVIFFIVLAIRSMIFAVREARAHMKQLEQQTVLTEA